MGLRSNGEEGSLARRNKHLMGEKVRDAGVRAVKQANVTNVEDLRVFCDNLKGLPFKCVVKPVQVRTPRHFQYIIVHISEGYISISLYLCIFISLYRSCLSECGVVHWKSSPYLLLSHLTAALALS